MRPWQLGKGSVRPKWHGGVVLDGMLLCWLGGVVKHEVRLVLKMQTKGHAMCNV